LSRVTLLSATEQLALLRAEKISPVELAEEHIREINRLNPQLNAIVRFSDADADRILTQARALMAASGPRGPL
jgi:Asp-tRNA(Asn)/Glu-tRNA(Gln) amidotransferase A subunit family amidase